MIDELRPLRTEERLIWSRLIPSAFECRACTQPDVKPLIWSAVGSFQSPFRVEGLSGFDQFADDAEEPVCDPFQGAGALGACPSIRNVANIRRFIDSV